MYLQAVETKSQILAFFGILSVAHADVHAVLVGCQVLVPSLVAFLAQMATLIWGGDEFVTTSEAIGRWVGVAFCIKALLLTNPG